MRCLDLVASEHPDLDAGLAQRVDRLKHILLQLVFDAGHRQELHLVLERHDCVGNFLLTVAHAGPGCLEAGREVVVLGLGDELLRDDERAETVTRQVLAELLARGSLTGLHLRGHNDIGTLNVEDDLTALLVSHNDSHALRFRAEGEVLQDLVLLAHTIWVRQVDQELFTVVKLHVELLSKLDEGDLIRARRLELLLCLVVSIRVDWRDIVAQRESKDQIAHDEMVLAAEATTTTALTLTVWHLGVVTSVIFSVILAANFAVGALAILARLLQLLLHVIHIVLAILRELHRDLLKNHIILRQGSRLV